jgi:homoserine dehydrogenase
MGGIDIPLAFVKKAIAAGKIVITGNKALLAEHGHEIFQLVDQPVPADLTRSLSRNSIPPS